MSFELLRGGIQGAQTRLYDAQRKNQSGKRVERPSDDPVAAARSVLLHSGVRRLESMDKNAQRAGQELAVAESALGHVGGQLIRARELIIQSLDGILLPADRAALAHEVRQLRDEVTTAANTRIAETYVFGGYRTDVPPFDGSGAFVGVPGVRTAEVERGMQLQENISGDEIFGAAGGVDVLAMLSQLATDLDNNDYGAIELRLGEIGLAEEQVLNARTELGGRLVALDRANETRADGKLQMEGSRAELVELDLAAGYVDLIQAGAALDAAIAQATKVIQRMENSLI